MEISQHDLNELERLAAKCGFSLKSYKVRMNKTYVRALLVLVKISNIYSDSDGWFKVGQEELGKTLAHDLNHMKYSKLRYWGLIEKGKGLGVWRVTKRGYAFLNGEVKVPSYVQELRAQPVRFSTEFIDVSKAFERQFNLAEESFGISLSSVC